MIRLRFHSVIDYLSGSFLIIAPWLFAFARVTAARNLFLLAGLAQLSYTFLTGRFSISRPPARIRRIPLGIHMTLDTLLGLGLILAPTLFKYRDQLSQAQIAVHLVFGIALAGLVALTHPQSEEARIQEQARLARLKNSNNESRHVVN